MQLASVAGSSCAAADPAAASSRALIVTTAIPARRRGMTGLPSRTDTVARLYAFGVADASGRGRPPVRLSVERSARQRAPVEPPAAFVDERVVDASRAQLETQGARRPRIAERETLIVVKLVVVGPARAGHELRDPVDRLEPLKVVVMTREGDEGPASEVVPNRLQVRLIAVPARTESWPVHEHDPTGAGLGQLAPQPALLSRSAAQLSLRVEAHDLPAGEVEGVEVLGCPPARRPPVVVVGAVALRPFVVAGRRCSSASQLTVGGVIVLLECSAGAVAEFAGPVDVPEVQQAVHAPVADHAR